MNDQRYKPTVLIDVTTVVRAGVDRRQERGRDREPDGRRGSPRRRRSRVSTGQRAAGPSSRANAQITRELHVTADSPQNHMAIAASAANPVPAPLPSASIRITITGGTALPPASFESSTVVMSRIDSVSANRSR